jgi:hypothetical protein
VGDYRADLLRSKYGQRDPYWGEEAFFAKNPAVAGYAAPDQKVVLNPYSQLSPAEKDSVALNESARLHMMDKGTIHGFPITPGQQQFFSKTAYGQQPQMARHTIVARILSGDPSAGPYTPEQKAAADGILWGLLMDRKTPTPSIGAGKF